MKIISFCLYGTDPLYVAGMKENIRLAPLMYPGWQVRIYTDLDLTDEPFKQPHVRVVKMKKFNGHSGMFARFLAVTDPEAEYVIFRDADSRLNVREKAAVDEWIASGKEVHVMRDHDHHANWIALGGMFGLKCKMHIANALPGEIKKWPRHTEKLDDMRLLADLFVKSNASSCWMHHSSVPTPHPYARPFPPHPEYKGYVGEIIQP